MVLSTLNIADVFAETARRLPEKPCLVFEGRTLTYAGLLDEVRRVAGALAACGLRPGQRVALYLGNSPSFVSAYLGVLSAGGVVVPVNTAYRETELRHILSDAQPRLVVTDAQGVALVRALQAGVPGLDGVVEAGRGLAEDRAAWERLAGTSPVEPAPGRPGHDPRSRTVSPDDAGLPTDLAVIMYTSGTTGRSKGAMLTHGNFLSNSRALTSAWGWTAADRLLLALPLFHMHGLGVGLHGAFLQGSTITLLRRFDAAEVLRQLVGGAHTLFFGVPTMYVRLLAAAGESPERPRGVRLFVSGSAPLAPETLAAVEQTFGLRLLERYGMTETVMNAGNPLTGERKAGAVGVPFAGVELRIADRVTGAPLADGQTGEIQVRGPNVFRGYWRNAAATQAAFTPDGWFRTGDLGYRDTDGYYFLTGRASELIISGGFNIYPREIEEVLERHPGVREAAVLGMPDAEFGERVVAVVVRRAPELRADELAAFCKERLASFKKPRRVHFVDELPRNPLGKVQKHVLRQRLADGTDSGSRGTAADVCG